MNNTTEAIMSAQSMMVDPNDLVSDLPVNEARVQELLASVAEEGVYSAVDVHYPSMRIIDGFHRAEAARRAGIKAIPAMVVELDEEAFWSRRIISARPHAVIEPARIALWMQECWKQTKWYVPLNVGEMELFPRAYSNTSIDLRLVELVWSVFFKKLSTAYAPNSDALTEEEREVRDWVLLRSQQWGIHLDQFAEMFLSALGIRREFTGGIRGWGQYDQWAREYNLNLKQRLRLQNEIRIAPGKYSQPPEHIAEEYIEQKIVANVDDGEDYYVFAERKLEEKREEQRRRDEEENRLREAFLNSPEQKALREQKERKQADTECKEFFIEVKNWFRSFEPVLKLAPSGFEIFTNFIAEMEEMRVGLWPESAKTSGVQEENRRLRAERKALTQENESLRRALAAKARVSGDLVAMPGSEVKRLVAS